MATKNFTIGHTYTTRLICDSNSILSVKILDRTAKTVKASVDGQPAQTFRIKELDGQEIIKPWGTYSMAPTIRA